MDRRSFIKHSSLVAGLGPFALYACNSSKKDVPQASAPSKNESPVKLPALADKPPVKPNEAPVEAQVTRSTTVVLRIPNRPADSHKDAYNYLFLAISPENQVLTPPRLRIHAGGNVWRDLSPNPGDNIAGFPNLVISPDMANEDSPAVHLAGWRINNRDENLVRVIAATFRWKGSRGSGDDIIQTSMMNAYQYAGQQFFYEKVAIGLCVPHDRPTVTPNYEYRESDLKHPWGNVKPAAISIAGADLPAPPGYIFSGLPREFANSDMGRHQAIRISALLNVMQDEEPNG